MLVSDIVRCNLESLLVSGDPSTRISGISYDSRSVKPGDAFFAIMGLKSDGHQFVGQALANGAAALVVSQPVALPVPGAAMVMVRDTRLAMARAAAALYGYPSRDLLLVGVTGTKGKTTTTHLVRSILETAGSSTGLIGTVHNIIGGEAEQVTHTTPEAPELQERFRRMINAGDRAAVMEVSSHALAMQRVACSEFTVGALTNIGHDHLDFHGTQQAYLEAKAALFKYPSLRAAVFNQDDPASAAMGEGMSSEVRSLTYGLRHGSDVRGRDLVLTPSGVEMTVEGPAGSGVVRLNLPGRFNAYNALCALTIGIAAGCDLRYCLAGLAALPGVPGRFERVDAGQPFAVIVDYAHTPESLANVLETAREFTSGQLVAVFGCGGDRDRTRRPTMGRIAAERADFSFVTSDNPRSEDPEGIIDEIVLGMAEAGTGWARISDRAAAIEEAIGRAKPGDVVVICGKGHETYQVIGNQTIHFDDREVALAALAHRGYDKS